MNSILVRRSLHSFVAVLIALSTVQISRAADDKELSVDIEANKGMTYLELMEATGGIKEMIDKDYDKVLTIPAPAEVHAFAKKNLAPEVYAKVIKLFNNGESDLDDVINALRKSSKVTPANIVQKIRAMLGGKVADDMMGLAPLIIAPVIATASGAGSRVTIDGESFFFNYGYLPGADAQDFDGGRHSQEYKDALAKALKSGRSFAAGPLHQALDASDPYYLKELDKYLSRDDADPVKMMDAILRILMDCDTSVFKTLDKNAKQVAADFLAIYTAELDRHIMANLGSHPWENDLGEGTLLAIFVNKTKVFFDKDSVRSGKPKLIEGSPVDFNGIGHAGSGLGVVRDDRRAMQELVTLAMDEKFPEVTKALRAAIGVDESEKDLIHALMNSINNREAGPKLAKNKQAIYKAMNAFVKTMSEHADELLEHFTDSSGKYLILKKEFIPVICRRTFKAA